MVLAVGLLAVVIGSSKVFAAEQDACRAPVATKEGPVRARKRQGSGMRVSGHSLRKTPGWQFARRPPDPVERSAPLAAAKISAQCIQASNGMPSLGNQKESEDCLYLNIWRPQKKGKFPVMVWIHGGDYINGSGGYPMYWGDHLAAQKDVVFVSINYRLGALGFLARRELSKEDAHSSSGCTACSTRSRRSHGCGTTSAIFLATRATLQSSASQPEGGVSAAFCQPSRGQGCSRAPSSRAEGATTPRQWGKASEDGDEFAASVGCTGADALQCLRKTSPKQIVKATSESLE